MTERKPADVTFETWIDRQIRDAAQRGEFDNLPGAGKPLPGAGQQDDENWWLNSYLRREGVTGETLLPTRLLLRREIDDLPDTVRLLASEERVRDLVGDLNRRIVQCLREPSDLRIPLRRVNVDEIVARWRESRPAERTESSGPAEPAAETERPRRWWRRYGR
jgi:hypothetical protein